MADRNTSRARSKTPEYSHNNQNQQSSHSETQANPVRSHNTPPNGTRRRRNPFETHLLDRCHTTIFSPSVFKISSQQQSEPSLSLNIDEMSHLNPVDIDENAVVDQSFHHLDAMVESSVQAKIDLFFSNVVVPSPLNQEANAEPLVKDIGTPVRLIKRTCEASTQTALSLPMTLPPELEEALRPYFDPAEVPQPVSPPTDIALYERLFVRTGADHGDDLESVESSPPRSIVLSPHSPIVDKQMFKENFVCALSPIHGESKTSPRLMEIDEHMSVDVSTMSVPDICSDMPRNEHTSFDCSFISMKEDSGNEDSSINWDLENNKIVGVSTPTKNPEMDVSNSNTPKSSYGYRKKLSNSLGNCENKIPMKSYVYKSYGETCSSRELTDHGYKTGELTKESYSMNTFTSTPSKRQTLL